MQLVIFDVDGTLIYSERRDSKSFAEAFLQTFNRPVPTIDWHNYPHVTDTNIFDHLMTQLFGRAATPDQLETFMSNYLEKLAHKRVTTPGHYRTVPGSKECLQQLAQLPNTVLGIGTGGWKKTAELKLTHVQIAFEHLFFHGADGHYTRESIIEAVIKDAKSAHPNIERVVYIGDALWDVKTTRNMNLPFIGIRWRNDKHILEDAGAQHVLRDFTDFSSFLHVLEDAQPPK